MNKAESKLLPIGELQEGGVFTSVVVKCNDCDFFRIGSLQFSGAFVAEGKTVGSCRNHHMMEDFKHNPMLDEKDRKSHNFFSISISSNGENVGHVAISSQTKAQIYLYENAKPHIEHIP